MRSLVFLAVLGSASTLPGQNPGINDYGPPEYGHGLSEKDALSGWISLFDGSSTFGWQRSVRVGDQLYAGFSTSSFCDYDLKVEVSRPGKLMLGRTSIEFTSTGPFTHSYDGKTPGQIELRDKLAVKSLVIRPRNLESLFDGKDWSTNWKRIDHAKLPKERWPTWTVKDGLLTAVGGPGALEYQGKQFGDGVLQIEARMNKQYVNGGFFFRAIPGDFMNGYEAQLYNRCKDNDPGKPATWATGAIDDRQNTRRLTSRDGQFFVMTVVANGPHLATWVNGYQTVDWTDTRKPHANPRQGKRVEAGVIQLQAHDPETDLTFKKVAAAAW